MKKIVCSFVFGLMLMVAGAQAWADSCPPVPVPPNPKLTSRPVLSDGYPPVPNPPNPKLR